MQSETELRLPDIKSYLNDIIEKDIRNDGYKFNKTRFSFVSKRGKDYNEIKFLFYNHFPLKYQVQFLLINWNAKIQEVKRGFENNQQIDNLDFSTLTIPMGEFVGRERLILQMRKDEGQGLSRENDYVKERHQRADNERLTWAQISVFSYDLVTAQSLFEVAEEINAIIRHKVLPLVNQLASVEGIDDFFSSRPQWAADSLSLNHLISGLVAAKISGKRKIDETVAHTIREIDRKISADAMSERYKEVVYAFYDYLLTPINMGVK